MLQQLIHWVCFDDASLGLPRLSGAPATRELGRPMMLMNVVCEFCGSDASLREKYAEQLLWSTQAILQHVNSHTALSTTFALYLAPSFLSSWYTYISLSFCLPPTSLFLLSLFLNIAWWEVGSWACSCWWRLSFGKPGQAEQSRPRPWGWLVSPTGGHCHVRKMEQLWHNQT